MIIELTKENLQKCGFDEEQVTKLLEWDKYDIYFFKDTCYYATNIENNIYTEIDGFRKYYFENGTISFPMDCPDLIPNYFDLALKNYLDKQILLLNTMFVEADQKEKFVLNEIEKIKSSIEVLKEDLKIKIYLIRDNKKKQIDILDSYLNFLKNKLDNQPQQIESIKPDEVKKELHNAYFKNNAFEVWQSMFDEFGINESSRTDVKFIFEEMKKEGLIHNTVNQTTFLDWISATYNGLIIQKTSNHSRTNVRLQAYSRAKELYKK